MGVVVGKIDYIWGGLVVVECELYLFYNVGQGLIQCGFQILLGDGGGQIVLNKWQCGFDVGGVGEGDFVFFGVVYQMIVEMLVLDFQQQSYFVGILGVVQQIVQQVVVGGVVKIVLCWYVVDCYCVLLWEDWQCGVFFCFVVYVEKGYQVFEGQGNVEIVIVDVVVVVVEQVLLVVGVFLLLWVYQQQGVVGGFVVDIDDQYLFFFIEGCFEIEFGGYWFKLKDYIVEIGVVGGLFKDFLCLGVCFIVVEVLEVNWLVNYCLVDLFGQLVFGL